MPKNDKPVLKAVGRDTSDSQSNQNPTNQNQRDQQGQQANLKVRKVNLALQGGGSHGAFTWGVLDRLLEEDSIEYEGLSGTSAGAMNAVVFASGYSKGGREGARKALTEFWTSIGKQSKFSPLRRGLWDIARGKFSFEHSLSYRLFNSFTNMVSPYQWNPVNFNPLQKMVREHVDFDAVHNSGLKLFLSATCVETGRIRVFRRHEIDENVLLASSALPFIFQAVKIKDRHFWDGGYCGNPALFPLFYECETLDLMIIQINPLFRAAIPTSAFEIEDRVAEIAFNVNLANEIRAIHFVTRLVEKGALDPARYRKVNIHLLESEEEMRRLAPATKILTEPAFLKHLFDLGRAASDKWIKDHLGDLGVKSSVNIKDRFLDDDHANDLSAEV
jgi:NTE family protein